MALPVVVELGVVLTVLAASGSLAHRLGHSVIPAYILAGILVGPSGPASVAGFPLAVVARGEFVAAFADLGLVALLFFLGVHVDFERLADNYRPLIASGLLDFAFNAAVGIGIAVLFGASPLETLFVAGIVYVSSSAIITKGLVEHGWLADVESEPILGVLVFEDLVVAVYLVVLSSIALRGGGPLDAAIRVGTGLGFAAGLALVGWHGTQYVERFLRTSSDELFVLRVLGVATLTAGAATFTSVSIGVVAFVVGAAVGRTDLVARVERTLAPIRDLFSAVFFFAVGLATDLAPLFDLAGLLVVAVVVTTASKLATGVAAGKLYGLDPRRSLRVGVGVVARGEFSLVLATLASGLGAVGPARFVPEFGVGYVLVTSVLGTLLMRHEERIARISGLIAATGDSTDESSRERR